MNVFGVGPTEIFVVLIVILVLFGPDKLPELAKKIGGASKELRGNLDSINEQMNDALELSIEQDKARMAKPAEITAPSTAAATIVDSTVVSPTSSESKNQQADTASSSTTAPPTPEQQSIANTLAALSAPSENSIGGSLTPSPVARLEPGDQSAAPPSENPIPNDSSAPTTSSNAPPVGPLA